MVELADIVADLIAAEHVAAASVILRGLPTSTPFTKNGNDIRSHVRSRVSAKAMFGGPRKCLDSIHCFRQVSQFIVI